MVFRVGVSCSAARRPVVADIQKRIEGIEAILDLGCGVGAYGRVIRSYLPRRIRLYGVDGYLPYLYTENPRRFYTALLWANVLELIEGNIRLPVDCVLCMDVIEHFEQAMAMKILAWLHRQKLAYISTPLFWMEQDALGGNELERHKCNFTEAELNHLGWWTLGRFKWDQRGDVGAFRNVE